MTGRGCTTCEVKLNKNFIKCSRCSEAFHRSLKCTGIKKTDLDKIEKWHCYICEPCFYCKKDDNEVSYICDGCNRNFHISCLDPPVPPGPTNFYEKWFCSYCSPNLCRQCQMPVHSKAEDVCIQCQSGCVCAECLQPYARQELPMQCITCNLFYHATCEESQNGRCGKCTDGKFGDRLPLNGFVSLDGVEVRKSKKLLIEEKQEIPFKYEQKKEKFPVGRRRSSKTARKAFFESSDLSPEILEKIEEGEQFFGASLFYSLPEDNSEDENLKWFEKHEKKVADIAKDRNSGEKKFLSKKVVRELTTQINKNTIEDLNLTYDQVTSPHALKAGFGCENVESPRLWIPDERSEANSPTMTSVQMPGSLARRYDLRKRAHQLFGKENRPLTPHINSPLHPPTLFYQPSPGPFRRRLIEKNGCVTQRTTPAKIFVFDDGIMGF
ncbi:unnamed protein product [Bursaphelenchus okinawaensis]|uniref:PHD-type domain-containing protein n=1 Tax=Bursaphelenchus okinawaensis TaxID=465554 RepID=A0A811K8X2_9BILA|nr:unnamed protein product [Bursaphelenchus okinawaensis]CAG9094488.1 unnamed protein product [Bursaphelenchus okinawaensis]